MFFSRMNFNKCCIWLHCNITINNTLIVAQRLIACEYDSMHPDEDNRKDPNYHFINYVESIYLSDKRVIAKKNLIQIPLICLEKQTDQQIANT